MTRDEHHLEETAHQVGRLADAVDELVDEVAYQNAVLAELAHATWYAAVAESEIARPEDKPEHVPSLRGLRTNIRDHQHDRDRDERQDVMTDGGTTADDGGKSTPPVPPADRVPMHGVDRPRRTVRSEAVETCDCGGVVYDQTIKTGRVSLLTWDDAEWDPDEYRLTAESEAVEHRVYCDHCGVLYTY
jgi:hypothetical protein